MKNRDLEEFVGFMLFALAFIWFFSFPFFMAWLLPVEIFIWTAASIGAMWLLGFGFLGITGMFYILHGFVTDETRQNYDSWKVSEK